MIINLKKIYLRIKDLVKQPLIVNILIVASVTLCIKIIGFYKETVIASTFGLSQLLDTFYIAVLIPTFVQNVFINALKNIFIPNYITEISEDGNKGAFQAVIFTITFLISSFFFILIILFMSFFFKHLVSWSHGRILFAYSETTILFIALYVLLGVFVSD